MTRVVSLRRINSMVQKNYIAFRRRAKTPEYLIPAPPKPKPKRLKAKVDFNKTGSKMVLWSNAEGFQLTRPQINHRRRKVVGHRTMGVALSRTDLEGRQMKQTMEKSTKGDFGVWGMEGLSKHRSMRLLRHGRVKRQRDSGFSAFSGGLETTADYTRAKLLGEKVRRKSKAPDYPSMIKSQLSKQRQKSQMKKRAQIQKYILDSSTRRGGERRNEREEIMREIEERARKGRRKVSQVVRGNVHYRKKRGKSRLENVSSERADEGKNEDKENRRKQRKSGQIGEKKLLKRKSPRNDQVNDREKVEELLAASFLSRDMMNSRGRY